MNMSAYKIQFGIILESACTRFEANLKSLCHNVASIVTHFAILSKAVLNSLWDNVDIGKETVLKSVGTICKS